MVPLDPRPGSYRLTLRRLLHKVLGREVALHLQPPLEQLTLIGVEVTGKAARQACSFSVGKVKFYRYWAIPQRPVIREEISIWPYVNRLIEGLFKG